jgi:endonuclease YncB( thermonuclease family)
MKPNFVYAATITRVIDGDTVVADIDLGFHATMRGVHVRLARINAPELWTGEPGEAARAALQKFIGASPSGPVSAVIESHSLDKYGRVLGEVWVGDVRASDWMVANKQAAPYYGRNSP